MSRPSPVSATSLLLAAAATALLGGCGSGGPGGVGASGAPGVAATAPVAPLAAMTAHPTSVAAGGNLPEPGRGADFRTVSPLAISGSVPYTPTQIRQIYGFSSVSATGAGQTIAIVDAMGSPTLSNDLAHFSATFGLPTASMSVVYPAGRPTTTDPNWAMETSLDVEWAHAIAPQAKILVVVAPSSSLSALLSCVNYAAQYASVVSMSWGASEFSSEGSYDGYFSHSGVSYFASAGDSGAAVLWPGVSTRVTSVGGTTVNVSSTGTVSEIAWSGSGGGVSAYLSAPAWQTKVQTSGRRTVPDIGYDANPSTGYYVYDTTTVDGYSGWLQVGGTSAGAPQWAALTALVNSKRTTRESGINAVMYSFGSPSTDYTDIVSGTNGKYACHSGYDYVTGLGSPRAASLVPALISR